MNKLSVVINTINEEKNLPHVLASINALADEIIVVDMHSDDKTVQIAKAAGAKVFTHERTNFVEPARNFAISKASGEWILVLDADETVPKELVQKLKELIEQASADYYRIPRKNLIFGKWITHSFWWPDYNIRLFKKGKVSWNELIHSVPITIGIGADLEAKEEYCILHNMYSSISQFVDRLNRYTSIQANQKKATGYKFSWLDIIKKPSEEFLRRYFAESGYKDGIHGLALANLQAFSEVVLYLKVWELEKFKEEKLALKEVVAAMKQEQKDKNYWYADSLLKNGGGIALRLKRKLKI